MFYIEYNKLFERTFERLTRGEKYIYVEKLTKAQSKNFYCANSIPKKKMSKAVQKNIDNWEFEFTKIFYSPHTQPLLEHFAKQNLNQGTCAVVV